jgi:cytosine/adenosine deaminase-related metal-dependent hydrolase
MIPWKRPVSFVNAHVVADAGRANTIRFGSRILSVGEPPRRGDVVVDLQGAVVLPGLINAHDHLELNHYGRIADQSSYGNVAEWIADMDGRLSGDPAIRAGRAQPLDDRLFIGVLKNLLAGVTTVAHHNPYYRQFRRVAFIHVLRRYGWAHSFLLEDRPAGANGERGGDIVSRFRATPSGVPFIVHLAEGVDATARAELERFEALGCLASNSVLVHGVAIGAEGWTRVIRQGAGAVWCPASNQLLFGRTAAVRDYLDLANGSSRLALGTDSRLTGSRDLLDEIRQAASLVPLTAEELLRLVTSSAADLLRLPDTGRLTPGAHADLVVIPAAPARPRSNTVNTTDAAHVAGAAGAADAAAALLATTRRDVLLTVARGRPLVGAPGFDAVFRGRRVRTRCIRVDGTERLCHAGLAAAIRRCAIPEPGVTCA